LIVDQRSVVLPSGDKLPFSIETRDVKNARLRLDPDGTLTAVVSSGTHARALIQNQRQWLADKYREQQIALATILEDYGPLTDGFTLWGKSYVRYDQVGKDDINLADNTLVVTTPEDRCPTTFLAQQIREALKSAIESLASEYCESLNESYDRLTIRAQRTKWASCSQNGTLSFNIRCAFLPMSHLRYLVAHELAHLVESNHNERFWNLVESFVPSYQSMRTELQGFWYALHHSSEWRRLLAKCD